MAFFISEPLPFLSRLVTLTQSFLSHLYYMYSVAVCNLTQWRWTTEDTYMYSGQILYHTTGLLMITCLSLCKFETSCSCFLSCVTILSHSALASWYCSRARASLSSAFCRASFSFSRSASALSRSVVSIDLIAFV